MSKVEPLYPPRTWRRTIDGKCHEVIGRRASIEERPGWRLIVLMPAASYWIDRRMVANFPKSQITIFEDKWTEVTP